MLAYLNYFFLAVTKSKEVEICMVKHWRVDREEKYEIVEKWFLKDLEMIDGKEADTVSVTLCIMYIENNFLVLQFRIQVLNAIKMHYLKNKVMLPGNFGFIA